jgi:tripartite-type tricarboxylate transporter receptor subunit TctC
MRKEFRTIILGLLVAFAASGVAVAQGAFPTKPVKFIVPFPARRHQ